ncbi:MAG: 3-deoxy-D-manno-octulosonic acid transferase, partial [Acidobacteria bacterium]|nr:3-deoxy-D-manno-octulosonic acid transferase [Acidobacteriota bacterium]
DGRVATHAFPLDVPYAVRRFFREAAPRLLVLVETELWPFVLLEAARQRVPVLLVNGRISERSTLRLSRLQVWLKDALGAITRVAARTPADAARFLELGLPESRVFVGGDLKYDKPLAEEPAFAPELSRLANGRPVVVAGSFANGEIPLFLDALDALPGVFAVIAPRQPATFDAVSALVSARFPTARRSAIAEAPGDPRVLILDSLGELAGTYRLGDVAVLGGTFEDRGGHDVLEPLRAERPVILGPSDRNLGHALREAPAAIFRVPRDAGALAARITELLANDGLRLAAAEDARALFARNQGAASRAARAARELLSPA